MGLLLFELETEKAGEALTAQIPGRPLCGSNTSALHLIQQQQMPPLSPVVARFLSPSTDSSFCVCVCVCFCKGYCFLSRHLGQRTWRGALRVGFKVFVLHLWSVYRRRPKKGSRQS